MSDALRFDRPPTAESDGRERDARIEELLLIGLDHYFGGRHELAINVWTRVLFLDRSHAKARAYIERARSALAERHREAEELLHTGQAALHRGDHGTARRLLTSAAHAGGGDEVLSLLHRLDRLDATVPAAMHQPAAAAAAAEPARAHEAAVRDPRVAWVFAGVVTGVLLAAIGGAYLWIVADPFELAVVRTGAPALRAQPLPMPSGSEIRLTRARRLFAEGQLHAALALLESGEIDERNAASFNELRAAIQRQLLAAGRQRSGFATGAPSRGGGAAAGGSGSGQPR